MRQKTYQSYVYKGNTVEGASDNNKKGSTRDRAYTQKLMDQILKYFRVHDVKICQNLINGSVFKKISKDDQITLLSELKKIIGKDEISFNNRVLKKSNTGERNILLNYYAHKYPNETKSFLKQNLHQEFIQNFDNFLNIYTDNSNDFNDPYSILEWLQ